VAGHIFQARPVWIYTQSNITNIYYLFLHYIITIFELFIDYFKLC
jgi:hypothetical protein